MNHSRRGFTNPSLRAAKDALTGSSGASLGSVSGLLRRAQNGFVRSYALTMLLGVVVILGAVWVMQ